MILAVVQTAFVLVAVAPFLTSSLNLLQTATAAPKNQIEGTEGPNTLTGTPGNDKINSKGGNDRNVGLAASTLESRLEVCSG